MTDSIILIVDDEPANLSVLSRFLQPTYRVLAANSGERALSVAAKDPPPSLILLDVMMPDMDGYEVLLRLKKNPQTQDIPVIFVTAMDATSDEEHGLELGAADYITKPVREAIVLARVRTQLALKQARDWLKNQNEILEAEVTRRMKENDLTQVVTIRALAHLAETRDPETGSHILRTQGYVHELAMRLKDHPRFKHFLTDRNIQLLTRSAPLHDIGKVGIPDNILLKPGKLNSNEWVIMQSHARLGAEAIERVEADIEQAVSFLSLAKEIARWHHEKWDGSGYPDGLSGEDIPISARLMALADVFDALISPRVYKSPMSFEKARDIIATGRGLHFDPDVTDVFLDGFDEFIGIARRYLDEKTPLRA